MKTFTLTIELVNSEMQTPFDVAEALKAAADNIEDSSGFHSGKVTDVNGNAVGHYEYRP